MLSREYKNPVRLHLDLICYLGANTNTQIQIQTQIIISRTIWVELRSKKGVRIVRIEETKSFDVFKILLSSDHCSHCSCKSVWGIIWSHWSHNPSFDLFFPNWPDGRLTTRTIPSKACQRDGRSTKEPEVFEIQIKTNCSNHVPTSPFVSAFSWFQKQRGRVCCFLSCLLFSSFLFPTFNDFHFSPFLFPF